MPRRVITKEDAERVRTYQEGKLKTAAEPPSEPLDYDNFREQIIKFIPGEVVAAFLTLDSLIQKIPDFSEKFYWIIFGILILATYCIAYYASKGPDPLGRSIGQALIATVAFFIWVSAIGGPFVYIIGYQTYMGGIILILFTLFAPILPDIYKDLQKKIKP
jgi:hypothetical protein